LSFELAIQLTTWAVLAMTGIQKEKALKLLNCLLQSHLLGVYTI